MKSEKMIVFVQPDEFGNAQYEIISKDTAIKRSKAGAKSHGKGYVYPNDELALEDFIIVHWAWEMEIPKGPFNKAVMDNGLE